MLTTPRYGLEYAEPSDFPIDFPTAVDQPRSGMLDTALSPSFADAASRDAWYAALPGGAADGMICYRTDLAYGEQRTGGAWWPLVGTRLRGTLQYSVASLPAGITRLIGEYAAGGDGGVTSSGDGWLIVPRAGLYLVTAAVVVGTANAWSLAIVQSDDGVSVSMHGPIYGGSPVGGGSALTTYAAVTPPQMLGLHVECGAPITTVESRTYLQVSYIAPM